MAVPVRKCVNGDCGKEISEARLRAKTDATLCIKCQEDLESTPEYRNVQNRQIDILSANALAVGSKPNPYPSIYWD